MEAKNKKPKAKNKELKIESFSVDKLKPYGYNPRKHDRAIKDMAEVFKNYGLRLPILIRKSGEIIDGHLRYKAAKLLGYKEMPVVIAGDDLTDEQVKGLRILINKSATWAEWDGEALARELNELMAVEFDIGTLGFGEKELDDLLGLMDENAMAPIANASQSTPDDNKFHFPGGSMEERQQEWAAAGMPECNSKDESGITVILHFKSESDMAAFSKLIGQPMTPTTRYLWFPPQERVTAAENTYE